MGMCLVGVVVNLRFNKDFHSEIIELFYMSMGGRFLFYFSAAIFCTILMQRLFSQVDLVALHYFGCLLSCVT